MDNRLVGFIGSWYGQFQVDTSHQFGRDILQLQGGQL